MGNLVPAFFWFPLAVAGLVTMAVQRDPLGHGLWLLGAATVVGWLALNAFGLFETERMKRQLERILNAKGEPLDGERWFVGFATPKYSSALDPHEDVGFLLLRPGGLRFVSEVREVDVPISAVEAVRFRGNVHSLLGLGRWVSVEGKMDERPIRLLVEPREHKTLLANRKEGARLRKRLEDWKRE